MLRFIWIQVAFISISTGVLAQSETDSMALSAFRKGRNLVGISGEVSSSMLDWTNIQSRESDAANSYRFVVRLGKESLSPVRIYWDSRSVQQKPI